MSHFAGGKKQVFWFIPTQTETNQKHTTKTTNEDLRVRWGGPKGLLTWPLNPSKKNKSKNKRNKHNPTTKTKQTKTSQKQNKTNKEGLGPIEVFGPPHLTLKPSQKNPNQKPTKKNTTHNTEPNEGNPKQQKQKPEHSNLICPTTTTTTSKQKTKKNKTNKRKGQHKRQRLLKANAKNLKNLQKNCAFCQTSPVNFWKPNLIQDSKTPMCTISVSFFAFYVTSGFGC